MRFLASDVAAATGGTLIGPDVPIEGVSFDSRSIAADELFVPVVAERDGHDFIRLALEVGAVRSARRGITALTRLRALVTFAASVATTWSTVTALCSGCQQSKSVTMATVA